MVDVGLRRCPLRGDQEEDLRAHFSGALATEAGDRSPMGQLLERLKYQLPQAPNSCESAADNVDQWIHLARRLDKVRHALSRIKKDHAEVLSVYYSTVPLGRVWGLVSVFGDREIAAVAVKQAEAGEVTPGASAWRYLNDLKRTVKGSKAWQELESRKQLAKDSIYVAQRAYGDAFKDVLRQARDDYLERWDRSISGKRWDFGQADPPEVQPVDSSYLQWSDSRTVVESTMTFGDDPPSFMDLELRDRLWTSIG